MGKKILESTDKTYWKDVSEKFTNYADAAKELGYDRSTVRKYMNMHGFFFEKEEMYPIELVKRNIVTFGGVKAAAHAMGIDSSILYNKLGKHGLSLTEILYEYQQKIAPEQKLQESIKGDCVITADFHCPFASLKWLNRVIEIGKKEGIKQLLIAGDFFDFDRLSYWLKVSNAEDMAVPLEDELSFSSMVLERLESQYDTIYFIGGNHWSRLLKNISFSVSSTRLLGLVDRANDPRYKLNEHFHWILIDDKVRVTHPGKARKSDYTLARDLAYIYTNHWLVVAHRHRVNEGFTPDGRPQLEIGWMGDTERMRYVQHVDSVYYQWVNGMAVYAKGKLKNLTEFNYDWEEIDKKGEVICEC